MVVRTACARSCCPSFSTWCTGSRAATGWGASNGEHGLKAKVKFDAEATELKAQLAGLKDERARWELRVASLRPESIDKDLLDEEAHALLDRVAKDEVVIFTGAGKSR